MGEVGNIDYKIKNHKEYGHAKGFKQISKIKQKSNVFKFQAKSYQYEIQANLTAPAIINAIQVKATQTNEIVFQFYNQGEKIMTQRVVYEGSDVNVNKNRLVNLGEKAQIFDKVNIRFLNRPDQKQTQISWIIFKGFKQQQSNKKVNRVKNVSDNDTFQVVGSKRKVNSDDRSLFDQRNKQKTVKTPAKDLMQQAVNYGRSNKKQSQDDQLKRVIQMSKKQYEKNFKKKSKQVKQQQNTQRKNSQVQQIKNQNMQMQQQQNLFFQYGVVQYDSINKFFQHVTPQWIQAQRKAQIGKNIQARHSLAAKIKIKVFDRVCFCLNNINGSQKSRLIKLIQQLGGKTIQQPKDHCIVVTNKLQGGKINLANSMKGIKFVKPEYIDDCDKSKAKLSQKDYKVLSH